MLTFTLYRFGIFFYFHIKRKGENKLNTIFETWLQTKRLELLRNNFHFCLREDCLPISTCSFHFFNIKVLRGIEPLIKVLTVLRIHLSAIIPQIENGESNSYYDRRDSNTLISPTQKERRTILSSIIDKFNLMIKFSTF